MTHFRWYALVAALILTAGCAAGWAGAIPPGVRGARNVSLLIEPGPLTITILKRDLNIYEGEDALTADLFDPLGRVIATLAIPDDGVATKAGHAPELQSATVTVDAEVAGIYRLAVRAPGDAVFGMETSAAKFVIGGDLLFSEGSASGSVYFVPPPEAFSITASALHDPGRQVMPLRDANGNTLAEFNLAVTGEAQTIEFPAGERSGLWHFEIGAMDVKIESALADARGAAITTWTTEPDAWFDVGKSRWMLLPYRTARYLHPGESTEIEYTLRNSTGAQDSFDLAISADPRLRVAVLEPTLPVELAPEARAAVRLAVATDADVREGESISVTLTASAAKEPQARSSSGLEVRIGDSPVSRPLGMPIVLRPFAHENVQFGYAPDYMTNEVYFDRQNRPAIRQRTESTYGTTGVYLLETDGTWVHRGFLDAIRAAYPDYRSAYGAGGFLGAKIAFDGQNGMYTMLQANAQGRRFPVLLFSPDRGLSWQVYELPGAVFDIEQFTGHNTLDGPPPILLYVPTGPHPATYASYNDLLIVIPRREGDRLIIGEPTLVAHNCLGSCQHSGGPASTVTRDGRTHIVWGEISGNPDGTGADERGVPEFVATYDHATGAVGEKVMLGYGPPVNDVHNVPAITMDSEGYLHVLIGSHGQAFQYARSLRPNDAYAGWTETVPILTQGFRTAEGEFGRQTYISLVCDQNDTLHTAFRQWRQGVDEYHGGAIYAALSIQHKPKEGGWSNAEPLVIPVSSGYSIWYHKLTVDRLGALYLSYSYWTDDETYQGMFPDRYHNPAVITSRDGGATWKLVETADFIAQAQRFAAR